MISPLKTLTAFHNEVSGRSKIIEDVNKNGVWLNKSFVRLMRLKLISTHMCVVLSVTLKTLALR